MRAMCEIMVTILARLNNHLKREEKHINLFLDNTKISSNIKVAFMLKNTTLRMLPLCVGTVKVWKICYKEVAVAYHLQVCGKA